MTTRKAYLLFGLFILMCTSLAAQVGESRRIFSVGINGGMNFNTVSFTTALSEPKLKIKTYSGYTGGITFRYISEKYFAMICGAQVEINYTQRGWEEDIEEHTDTYSRDMNYLEIPLLAHLAFGKDRGTQFFLNLGPQVAFLISEKENMSTPFTPSDHKPNEQYGKKAEKKFDYGITAGMGVEIKTKAGNFLLEGRYYFGLGDFYNSTKKDYFSRSAHSTIMARVTYLFDLTRQ